MRYWTKSRLIAEALVLLVCGNLAAVGNAASVAQSISTPIVAEGYFTGANGVRLFYRRVGSGRQVVVYLHGGPGSNFRGNGDHLEALAAGRTLIFYDQRGSGRSEIVAEPARLRAQDHVRDLEALRRHFRLGRMNLIGLSWGAGLAVLYAAEHPEKVARLALISPMSPTRTSFDERNARLNALLGEVMVQRRNAIRASLATANDEETLDLCREASDITFRLYLIDATAEKLREAARRCEIPPAAIRNRPIVERATIESLGDWDFRPMLARLSMPTLILEGAATNVPLEATRAWEETMPNARLVLVAAAGHELFLDQPQAFRAAVEQFLTGGFQARTRAPST